MPKKFLDYDGLVKVLQELQNYPDNTILGAVITAIQEVLEEKANASDVPSVLSDLIDDVGYVTNTALTNANYQNAEQVQSAITTAIGDINSFEVQVVQSLPMTGEDHTIYFVPQTNNSSIYDEYMYLNKNWELIGNTTPDIAINLATQEENGLMSSADKKILDNLNPNISVTISDIYTSETHVINAKQENMVDLEIIESPHISQQIRTSNLLNVDNFTPGFYIGGNGNLASNTNDHVGDFIPVSPGDNIYYTGIIGPTNSSSVNRRLHVYDATQKWIKQLNFAGSLKVGDHWSTNGVIPSNGAYIRVSWGVEDYNVMVSVGAPDKYWPYYITPFSPISSASFQLSPDDTYTNATTYTVTVPAAAGDLYGFRYKPIAGKLYATTGHIASYNGETLPSTNWYSDRDTYEEGKTPSIGAEVIYQLKDEDIVEYDITPQIIPMFFHVNYIKTDTGVIANFSYYAETFGVSHITISNGATIGNTDILESDVQGWKHAAESIDAKADLDSPTFIGTATAPTIGIAAVSDRIATAAFVQSLLGSIISQLQVGNKATKNYEIGDYFIYNGILYKVTAAIGQNGIITPGTNVEATNVMAEIISLLS